MEEFSRWTANKQTDLKHFLTPGVKFEAFCLATQQRNISLTRMVFSIYQLVDDKELFVKPIRQLISRRQYKEVSCGLHFGSYLHVFHYTSVIVLPLLYVQ